MTKSRILVVDDAEDTLLICAATLEKLANAEVVLETQSRRAAKRLEAESFDLLLTDMCMPEMDGVELLKVARKFHPDLSVVVITAYPKVETAVDCLKLGASDYVTKPLLPDDLLATVRRLLDGRRLREENELLQRQIGRNGPSEQIVGRSPSVLTVMDTIQKVAETDVDVLIVGETGTGKELVARRIHALSARSGQRFVPADCAAIPENLLESEFFGHERGAFTGATSRSMGLLEFADNGTLFLDEIAELPLPMQAKLLRTLQERRFRRVGGHEEITVDVRVLAATNRDLAEEMREKRFREDLYYRIHVARITLPPLRERPEDIPLLVQHFVERYSREMGKGVVQVDPEMLEILCRYPWPGNVRELQNVIGRTMALTRHPMLTPEDLPEDVVLKAGEPGAADRSGFFALRSQRVAAFEKEYLSALLRSYEGEVTAAAREAKIPRGTLYRLLKKHEINPEQFRG